ncbi:MAG: hypothetical protein JWP35_4737 [Caulobacter sp.]|nr:hypothetical protein [Caulobacter sp.]
MHSRFEQLVRRALAPAWVVALASCALLLGGLAVFMHSATNTPDPASGHIHAVTNHGTYYITVFQYYLLYAGFIGGVLSLPLANILTFIARDFDKTRRQSQRR